MALQPTNWILLVSAFALLPAIAILLTAAIILFIGLRPPCRHGDCVLVLGTRTLDGKPTPIHLARLRHALDLWKTGGAPLILLAGGVTERGATISEAEAGRQFLHAAGAPFDSLLTEDHSRWTSENLRLAAPLLAARNLHRVLLVTDPFHMARALLHAHRAGIHALPSPVPNCPRNTVFFLFEEACSLLRDAAFPITK